MALWRCLSVFQQVLSELQRVVLRSSKLDRVQMDMVLYELQQLMDAIDDHLEESMKDQLKGQVGFTLSHTIRRKHLGRLNGADPEHAVGPVWQEPPFFPSFFTLRDPYIFSSACHT